VIKLFLTIGAFFCVNEILKPRKEIDEKTYSCKYGEEPAEHSSSFERNVASGGDII